MASFGQLRLTKLGAQAQLNAQNGGTPMKFTKIGLGSGVFTGDAADLTALVKEEVLVGISKAYVENGAYIVEGSYANDNQDHSFTWREIGLYFEDENGSNVLYCYSNAGNRYDDIPATADDRYVKNVRIATAFTDADHVTIQVNPGGTYVEVEAFELFKTEVNNHYNNKENPHGVTAAQVGLWNVPNVTTNNQTPTYEEAASLAKLTSGEKLYLAMGKIAKAITDFISHLGDKTNPHGVTADQVNAVNQMATYYAAGSAMNADDLLDSLALIPVSTTVNSQLYGILSGTYAYVMTFFYSEKTLTARRTQVAMSYNTVPARMAVRLYGSNGWVDWQGFKCVA